MADFLYGIHPVREGLSGRRQPLELFVLEDGGNDRVQKLVVLAGERGVPVRRRRKADLDRLAGAAPSPGGGAEHRTVRLL